MVINCKFVKYGIAVANCDNQVARSNGERAINSVANLVNEGKALIIAPRANSQLASKVDEYIQATNSNNYNLQGDIGEEIADILFREVNP